MCQLSCIIFDSTELHSLVTLLLLCIQYAINYNYSARVAFHLSNIVFLSTCEVT